MLQIMHITYLSHRYFRLDQLYQNTFQTFISTKNIRVYTVFFDCCIHIYKYIYQNYVIGKWIVRSANSYVYTQTADNIQWVFSDIHRWTRSATTIKHHSGLLTEQLSRYPGETRLACLPAAGGWADTEARALGGATVWGRDAGEAVRPWWVNKFETRLGSRNGGIGSGSREIVVHSKPIWRLNAARPKLLSFCRRHFDLYFLEKSSYKLNNVQLTIYHWPALRAGLLCCNFFYMLTPVPKHHFFSSLILLFIYV